MHQKSILVVDDSAVSRMSLSHVLTECGYRVSAVAHGQEALTWIISNPPADVIITDLHMPQMDGISLIRRLRSSSTSYHDCPIFVLTAGADESEKTQVRQAGATGWIIKPFDTRKLLAAIERVVH